MSAMYVRGDLSPERSGMLVSYLRSFLEQSPGDYIEGTIDVGSELELVDEDSEYIRVPESHFNLRLRKIGIPKR